MAGIEETPVTVQGASNSNVNTVIAAKTVHGGAGNTYFFINLYSDGKKVGPRSSVRRESVNEGLQVDYSKKGVSPESSVYTDNEVVTTREAKDVSKFPARKDCTRVNKDIENIELRCKEDHFGRSLGIQWRDPPESENKTPDSIEEDFVFLKMEDLTDGNTSPGIAHGKGINGERSCNDTRQIHSVAESHGVVSNEQRNIDMGRDHTGPKLTAEGDDLLDISLREILNEVTGPEFIDTGQRQGIGTCGHLSTSLSEAAPYTNGTAHHCPTLQSKNEPDPVHLERVLGQKHSMVGAEESPAIQGERRRSFNAFCSDLSRITSIDTDGSKPGSVARDVDRSMIKKISKDIIFILNDDPMKESELSEEVGKIILALKHSSAAFARPPFRSAEVSTDVMNIAQELVEELFEIHKRGLRHKAKQLIASVMVIGRNDADKLGVLWNYCEKLIK